MLPITFQFHRMRLALAGGRLRLRGTGLAKEGVAVPVQRAEARRRRLDPGNALVLWWFVLPLMVVLLLEAFGVPQWLSDSIVRLLF